MGVTGKGGKLSSKAIELLAEGCGVGKTETVRHGLNATGHGWIRLISSDSHTPGWSRRTLAGG